MDTICQWFPNFDRHLEIVHQFWQGNGRYIVSVDTWQHPYRQLDDPAAMVSTAITHLEYASQLPGCNLPWFAADFGTVSTAKYWGGTPERDSTGENIFIEPVAQTISDALVLIPAAIENDQQDAARAIALCHELNEKLYSDRIWLRTPDNQGPLNTAGMVLNQEELLMALYTDADDVHRFLHQVTDHLIAYQQWLRNNSGGKLCGNVWPHTFLPPEYGVALTEDLMPLMSAKSYADFGIPTIRRMADALGPLHIHCCGEWGRHVPALEQSDIPICAVEFHYPFTTVDDVLPLAETGTVLVPMIVLDKQDEFETICDYYRHLLDHTDSHIRFWFACSDDAVGALDFAREWESMMGL